MATLLLSLRFENRHYPALDKDVERVINVIKRLSKK
jgi:hypothetical protein